MAVISSTLRPVVPLGAFAAGASAPVDFSDWQLEQRIDFQAGLLATAITPDEKLSAWEELKRLHAMRSPEMVAAMEAEMNL